MLMENMEDAAKTNNVATNILSILSLAEKFCSIKRVFLKSGKVKVHE